MVITRGLPPVRRCLHARAELLAGAVVKPATTIAVIRIEHPRFMGYPLRQVLAQEICLLSLFTLTVDLQFRFYPDSNRRLLGTDPS